jgi:uncharacterized repeat protein (TIGR03803 family)
MRFGNMYAAVLIVLMGVIGTISLASAATLNVVASFDGTNGQYPRAGLIADTAGNLYGTTERGGTDNDGTIFKLPAGSTTIDSLASFNGTNGSLPLGGLAIDSTGALYGTAEGGGSSSDGTIFKLPSGSSTIAALASFSGTNGDHPYAGVTDIGGTLYGTTELGGSSSDGNVFKLPSGSSSITNLASFDGDNGSEPVATMIADSAGDLYGTTGYGGVDGDGEILRLPPAQPPSRRSPRSTALTAPTPTGA